LPEPSLPSAPSATLRRVALVALATRVIYLAEHARSPLFTAPVLDGRYFELFGRALAHGEAPPGLATGFRPLLYPLLLAPLFALFGGAAVVVAQLLQHLAGVGTALVVATLARRLYRDERAALAAGVLYALAAPPLFFEGELLVESLFVGTMALWLLLATREEGEALLSPRTGAAAGALLALAAQLRPNVLLLLAVLPLLLRRERERRGALGLTAGTLAGLALCALVQMPLLGEFRLLPGAGAVNLYLGNERRADGLVPRQDFAVTYGDDYRDSVEVFAEQAYRRDPAHSGPDAAAPIAREALSRYWLARTATEIRADPTRWLALLGRKLVVLVWNGEVPNNRDIAFVAREESRWLRFTPVGFGILFTLALAGLPGARPGATRFWLAAFTVTHAIGVVAFFVADRYRLPLALPAAIFAGGGLGALVEPLRTRAWRRLAPPLALAALGALISFPDWTAARRDLPGAERDLLFRSIARLDRGEAPEALDDARRAAALVPGDAPTQLQLARAALAVDDRANARAALSRARTVAPGEPRVWNLLGVLSERDGDLREAYLHYRLAIELAPGFAPAQLNAGWLEARARRYDLVARRQWAFAAGEATVQSLMLEAELERADGDAAAAEALDRQAERLAPETFRRLRAELALAIDARTLADSGD
jgi:4-amino-4-deoxy-L-arabinose transferase-like glycosyltransferase